MPQSNCTHNESRARILREATVAFAQKGFQGASIRDITAAAGANVAAVSYHFGSKADLYREVLAHELALVDAARSPEGIAPCSQVSLPDLVRHLFDSLRAHQDSALKQILAHEEAAPSGVLGPALGDLIRPRHEQLVALLTAHAGASVSAEAVHRIAKTLVDAVKGYEMDREGVLAHIHPATFGGENAREAAIADLVHQARDLLEGAVRRHQGGRG